MNKTKIIILSSIGVAIGTLIGIYIYKKLHENNETENKNKEEEEEKEIKSSNKDDIKNTANAIFKERYDNLYKDMIVKNIDSGKNLHHYVNYNKPYMNDILKKYENEENEQIEEDLLEDDAESDAEYKAALEADAEYFAINRYAAESNGEPYLIEYEEFVDGVEGYEVQDLYFYTVDGVLCEDDDTKVEDWDKLVGYDFEDKLMMQTSAFVRNDQLMMLYEIHRIPHSYQKDILGIAETPKEREIRITKRRMMKNNEE